MTKEETLRMALDFIERTSSYLPTSFDSDGMKIHAMLKEALAQPEPTPTPNEGFEGSIRIFLKKSDGQWERLEKLEQVHEYNKQQLAQPEQEPVACVGPWHNGRLTLIPRYSQQTFERDQPLYTTPPQRKPLTEWQMCNIAEQCGCMSADWIDFARAIEAAHGIKE